MQHFISQNTPKNLQEEKFFIFQYGLLRRILILAFLVSFIIATFAQIEWLPMAKSYTFILYIHSLCMILAYISSLKYPKYYALYVQVLLLMSMCVLLIMTVLVAYDEFRLGWFFLLSVSAFILVGKRYGIVITLSVLILVAILFIFFDLHLSIFAFSTFVVSYFSFSIVSRI